MRRNAEVLAMPARRISPFAHHITLGAPVDRIPRLPGRGIVVEIVVVNGYRHDVSSSDLLLELDKAVGVAMLRLPERDQVLVTDLRRVSEICDVVLISVPHGAPCCMYMSRAYHPLLAATLCTPQCIKIPNFASHNQSGTRYCSSDSQLAAKFWAVAGRRDSIEMKKVAKAMRLGDVVHDEDLIGVLSNEADGLRQVPLEDQNVVGQPESSKLPDAAIEVGP